jgi:hypothetical protein
MYAVDAKPTVYLVNDTVVSTQPPAGAGADEMMKGVESGFAGSTHTQVVSSKSEKIGGYQGRRMEFASKDLTFKGFTIVAGKHNFVIITGGATGKFDKENIDNFLASFEVLNPDAS